MSMIVTIGEEHDSLTGGDPEHPTEAQVAIDAFWPKMLEEVKKIKNIEPGNQILPLARIKKIMKLDEDVKMISAEAPLLFAKACELFIHELTLRAWLHTDDNKRRTLQRNDIAMAISKYDQFDFLIDIVPRDEIKPKKESETTKNTVEATPVQFCYQTVGGTTDGTATVTPQTATVVSPNQLITSPMIIPIQQGQAISQLGINGILPGATAPQQLTLLQSVVGPNGEITQIPVALNQSQLNFIRAQLPQTTSQATTANTATQPIIIAQPTAAGQQFAQAQIISPTNQMTFLNAAQAQSLLQQQQQQQQGNTTTSQSQTPQTSQSQIITSPSTSGN